MVMMIWYELGTIHTNREYYS